MGCEQSIPVAKRKNSESLRKHRKKAEKVLGRNSAEIKLFENVHLKSQTINTFDIAVIKKIIETHFFFSSFSACDQTQLIKQMKLYETPKDEMVFKQKDPGTLFFIIKKGNVLIQINNQPVKQISNGHSFGELSLIYTAPRSASVKTLTNCQFWCLHQNAVRNFTQNLMLKNFKIGKPFLEKIPVFKFLSKKQLDFIAYSMNNLYYQKGEEIFKEGDDATAFYIIVQGQVEIKIKNKQAIILKDGDSFGENSFKKNQIRLGTASSYSNDGVRLLSISRKDMQSCLGGNIEDLVYFNIMRWALKRSIHFEIMPADLLRKVFKVSKVFELKDEEVVCSINEPVDDFFISLEGGINDFGQGVLVNENYFMKDTILQFPQKMKETLRKKGKGHVMFIPIKKIEHEVLKLSIRDEIIKNGVLFKKKIKTSVMDARLRKSDVQFTNLIKIRQLGQGQFGKVLLVRDNSSKQDLYALKCMHKKEIIENEMENYVKNEKKILEDTFHPFIVRLEQTFKDEDYIYLLMQYIDGIDFFDVLREVGLCKPYSSQFYLGCLMLAIEQLHVRNIVYRDLKPENAVVDNQGYLYLIDLGTAKTLKADQGYRTFTIIGTPHYMAPQMIQSKGYGLQVDIWSLGIILYQMVCGKLPYGDDVDDPYVIYKDIMKNKLSFPSFYGNEKGKNLIRTLLITNPVKRQIEDFDMIRNHEYFEDFDWEKLQAKKMRTPYKPSRKVTTQEEDQIMPILIYMNRVKSTLKRSHKKKVRSSQLGWDAQF